MTQVPHHAVANYGEPYAVDLAWQRWKEMVDKKHMISDSSNEENPGSKEETGVSDDALWEAVLNAMSRAYTHGWQRSKANQGYDSDTLFRYLERTLKEVLDETIDNPPDDPY